MKNLVDIMGCLSFLHNGSVDISNISTFPWRYQDNGSEVYNLSAFPTDICNITDDALDTDTPINNVTLISVICYGIICFMGLIGNGLVIFVIARYANMKTITNLYILNLSIADWLFLLGLPLIIATSVLKHWVFGDILCKLYYMLTCINMFTSSFTLVAMSIDRYLAVCHPVTSIPYRTRTFALCAIAAIWLISAVVILPVLLYTQTTEKENGSQSCQMQWPTATKYGGEMLFIIYTLLVGFIIPVVLICVLYSLLVFRLSTGRHTVLRRRSQRKVTRLVSTVIGVFVCSWLPYWAFQLFLISKPTPYLEEWHVAMFQCFTILSYANSMVNPLLYAFTNDHFRQAFTCAFHCAADNALARMQRRDSDYTSVRRNSNTNCDHASILMRHHSVVVELPTGNAYTGEKYLTVPITNGRASKLSGVRTDTQRYSDKTSAAANHHSAICSQTSNYTCDKLKSEECDKSHSLAGSPDNGDNGVIIERDYYECDDVDVVLHDTATQTEIPYEKNHVNFAEPVGNVSL